MNAPDLTPAINRRLWIGGALFGFTIGAIMSWTTVLTPLPTLRDVPIDSRRAMLAWTLMIGAGVLVGYIAGGINQQRLDTVAAARAVRGAILIATGQEPPLSELPRGFEVSGPALDTLRSFGARIRQPYRISHSRDDSTANEVVTDTRFQDGLLVRCVSSGAYISRCYEYEAP
jgi:hypothetical protein